MLSMAQKNGTSKTPAFILLLAVLMLALLELSAASTGNRLSSRALRFRARPSNPLSSPSQALALRSRHRFRGHLPNTGENPGRSTAPLMQSQENKQRASESVHVVSVQSRNTQEKSQPVYRAAVTKLKISEDGHLMEPKDLSVRVISSQSVLVTWVDPMYEKTAKVGDNRQYSIRYREKGESARWDYKNVNIRRALVDDLAPDAMYEFSVRITQDDKEGQWSSSVFQRTPESAPSNAPDGLYVEPLNGKKTAVRAMWDTLSDTNGRIKEYIISYAPAMKPFGAKSITYSGTTTSAIIDGLLPGERYIFKVRAANRRGQGPQSKAFTVTMPGSSTSTYNLYTQTQTEDIENEEEEDKEIVKKKPIVESKPSISESSLEETSQNFPRKRLQLQERSESKVQRSSISKFPNRKVNIIDNSQTTENMEVFDTTTAPKTSAPAMRRRIRPFSNPLHSRTKMVGQNPSSITQDNETKNPELLASVNHSTLEGAVTNIDDKSNEKNEEHVNEQYVPDLEVRKSSSASPVSSPVGKVTTTTNKRIPFSRVPTGQGNARFSSKPIRTHPPNQKIGSSQLHPTVVDEEEALHENKMSKPSHETLKIKPESKVTPPRKINPSIKNQSHSALVLSQTKESIPSSAHDSKKFDIETGEEKRSGNEDDIFPDISEKNDQHSTRHPEKSVQGKNNDDKQSRHYDHALVKSKTKVENEKKTKKTTLSGYKTIMTTVSTTLRTEPTTTPSPTTRSTTTTTTESTATYRSNRREYNEYKPKEIAVTTPIQNPPVKPFSGQSALSLLEYYRRRSSEIKKNVGTKIKTKTPIIATAHTTTTMLATTISTTLSTERLEYSNQDKTVESNVDRGGSAARMSSVPSKPLSKNKALEPSLEKPIPISTKPKISKKFDVNLPSTGLVKSKPKDVYDIQKEKLDANAKVEQSREIIQSRIPAKTSQQEPRKTTAVQDVKQTVHEAETFLHNLKSTTEHSQHSLDTSHGNRAKSSHDLKKEKDSDAKFTKHSSAPSSSLIPSPASKVDAVVPQQAISAQNKNTKVDDKISNKPSRSSNLHGEGNKSAGFRRASISKSYIPPSETDDHIQRGASAPSKSKLSTDDIHKHPMKPQDFEKVQDPTPSSRARQPSYSNIGDVKHGNINRDAIKKNVKENIYSQEQSEKLGDEEGLSAPLTIKENTLKTPGFPTSYTNNKYAILARNRNRGFTKAPTTTNYPQTTRPYQYRMLPSAARKGNFGSPSMYRTTHPPTTTPVRTASPTHSSRPRILNSRFGTGRRPFGRPFYRQGANGRQMATTRNNGNVSSNRNGNLNGQRIIYGPQGTKWVVDLNRGLVLNPEGRYLQDSTGKPLRIKMGGDGRTIIDMQGTPVVSPDGLPLFGHGRFSKPVASAQDKPVLSLGGRPLRGLEIARTTRIPTTRMTTRPTTTTPLPTTTTTTTPEPTTELTTIEPTTEEPLIPTCPPGSYPQYDEEGNLIMGPDDKPDCYEEDSFSGEDLIVTTRTPYLDLDQDYELFQGTLVPMEGTEHPPLTEEPEMKSFNTNLVSEFDVAGRKRFTAPYVSYINKDPNTPCSLTDALEHFQVENLADIIPTDLKGEVLPPQNISYNITVVAVEGCHSFVILDWAKPKKGDFITGYLVYSASYEDFIRNKWSARTATASNLPVENLKPNTRYYFKIQAKNPYGFAPMSPHVSFVTESDNPLLIVRPPGGEPIWIPFAFSHDTSFSDCSGKQYVKRTWYRKFVGVVLCNSLRYKIYLGENLRNTFYSIGDSWGRGEDHCQFVDSYMDGRTGPLSDVDIMPTIDGYYRQHVQEPVMFGRIGFGTPHNYVGWYECGVPIPGKW